MRLYLDIFSNEEIASDAYKMVETFDGTVIEIKSNFINVGGEKFDIGNFNLF